MHTWFDAQLDQKSWTVSNLHIVTVWRFCCNSIFYHKITQEQIHLRNKKLGNDMKVNIRDYDISFSDKNVVQFSRKFRWRTL